MFWVFAVLSVAMIYEAIVSLFRVIQFRAFFTRVLKRHAPVPRWPRVSLFAPCKGLEPGIEENIRSWFELDYPDYKIYFIVESDADPVLSVLRKFPQAEWMVAGESVDAGQKVHNLRHAILHAPVDSEVLAFVDSDCRLKPDWLRNLVAQLLEDPENAASGYRWFTSSRGFGSIARAAWNAGVLTLYREKGKDNFAWGGSTAIFRNAFESARVLDSWQGSISDDYSLTEALKKSNHRVNFVPGAIAFTQDSISFREFWKWAFRQLLITRIYHPRLWSAALSFHVAWFLWIATGIFFPAYFLPVFLLVQIVQSVKADLRWQCIRRLEKISFSQRISLWLFGPLTGLFNLLLLLSTIFTRRVRWRDVQYELSGPHRLTVHRR